jgi:hypothetical protein
MVCIFAYPIVDVGYAAARRMLHGGNPMRSDREHLHHHILSITQEHTRLNDTGTIILTTLSCSILGLVPAIFASINYSRVPFLMMLAVISLSTLVSINWLTSTTVKRLYDV